jgi:hypothetical protein
MPMRERTSDQGDPDQGEGLGAGEVRLVVPAAPEYLRLVRLTAAGLASRMGFTFDEVEDLRIAVDEVCFLLLDDLTFDDLFAEPVGGSPAAMTANGAGPRSIALRYRAGPDSIGIEGSTRWDGLLAEPSELSMQILNALVDEVEITCQDGLLAFRMVKIKEEL